MIYNVFQYSLAFVALLTFGISFLVKAKRGVLIWASLSAAAAGISAHYHVFWAFAVFTMMIPWALLCAGDWIDLNWRMRTGLVLFLAIGSALCIYPTYIDERFNAPDRDKSLTAEQQEAIDAKARTGDMGFGRFLRSNIPFRLVRGLDLKGGLRLVYNVDVQTAIREKRDRTHEQMYSSLAVAYGFTKDGDVAKESEKDKLDGLVKVEKSKDEVGKLIVTFNDPADKAKINDEFLKRYTDTFDVDKTQPASVIFRIKQEVEETTRSKAVEQAKETVHRRIDGLGLKEAAVTPSGEDIIVEVPGDDERQFKQVEDLIGETARLEFKMCDDGADFFSKVKNDPVKSKSFPKQLTFFPADVPLGEGKGSQTNQIPAWIKGDDETMESALAEFKKWVATLNVPDQRSVAFGKHYGYDSTKDTRTEDGWDY
jgi:preprotein translocase subunit SecD